MADTLRVELNREDLYDVATPPRFETDDDFVLRLHNNGEPTHVHVRADDELATALRPEGANHYVEAGATRDVTVRTDPNRQREVSGALELSVGHGTRRSTTEVTLLEPGAREVTVGSELSAPARDPPTGSGDVVRPAALAAASVLLVAAALVVGGAVAFLLGGLALVAIVAAAYSL